MDEDGKHGNGFDASLPPSAEPDGENSLVSTPSDTLEFVNIKDLSQLYILLNKRIEDAVERVNRHTDYAADKAVMRLFRHIDDMNSQEPLETRVNMVLSYLGGWCVTAQETLPALTAIICDKLQSCELTVSGQTIIIADRKLPSFIKSILPYLRLEKKRQLLLDDVNKQQHMRRMANWIASWLYIRDARTGTPLPVKLNSVYTAVKRVLKG